MHKEFVRNVNDYISEEFLGVETYGVGDPTPYLPEEVCSSDELIDAAIKSITPAANGMYVFTIEVEGRGDFTYQVMKESCLHMNVLLPKDCPGGYTEHVCVIVENVNESEISFKVVAVEEDVEDYEDDLHQPVIDLPHTYTVNEKDENGDDLPFYYQSKEVSFDAYTKLKSVSKSLADKYVIVISCGEDEESLKDYEYEVSEGTVLNLNICELSGGWAYGHAVLDCKVKVTNLSENKVTLTLLEEGDENLDK